MSKIPKLHEVLAVEGELAGVNKRILAETHATLSKKEDHFLAWHKTYDPKDEDGETFPEEHHEMVTTVPAKLAYMFKQIAPYIDAVAQKERTNQEAVADLEVDGQVIAEGLPATFLLGLESKLKDWRAVLDSAPTLAPGKKWTADEAKGKNVWVSEHDDKRNKTQKTVMSKVLYEATKEHPAQIEKWNENVVVGWTAQKNWSGMLSPAQKSEMLGRLDMLARSVKKARQRANSAELVKVKIGEDLAKFIMGDLA